MQRTMTITPPTMMMGQAADEKKSSSSSSPLPLPLSTDFCSCEAAGWLAEALREGHGDGWTGSCGVREADAEESASGIGEGDTGNRLS